jgi:hypothetical protein
LDHARREAAQSATAIVSSKYESTETDKGISHRQDQISTTKAFAKLIDKKESFTLDGESGLIKCEVIASFKAGFVEVESNEKIGSSTTELKAVAFKPGEPFCSRALHGCFREYYSKELNVFGIQLIRVDHMMINGLPRHKQSYFLITDVSGEQVRSKETFIKLIKDSVNIGNPNYTSGSGKGHSWGKMGYERRTTKINFYGYRDIYKFDGDVSEDFIAKVDDDIQKRLDLAAEF